MDLLKDEAASVVSKPKLSEIAESVCDEAPAAGSPGGRRLLALGAPPRRSGAAQAAATSELLPRLPPPQRAKSSLPNLTNGLDPPADLIDLGGADEAPRGPGIPLL